MSIVPLGERVTLDEFINGCGDSVILHIGCKNVARIDGAGQPSGYFFIGSKDEYARWIDKISDDALTSQKNQLENNKRALKAAIANGMPKQWYDDLRKRREPFEDYCQRVYDYSKDLANWARKIPQRDDYIKTKWKPLRDRMVVETYSKALGPNGLAILVDGVEAGAFWLREGFEAWMVKHGGAVAGGNGG